MNLKDLFFRMRMEINSIRAWDTRSLSKLEAMKWDFIFWLYKQIERQLVLFYRQAR